MPLYNDINKQKPLIGEHVQIVTRDGVREGVYMGSCEQGEKWRYIRERKVIDGIYPSDENGFCRFWKSYPAPTISICRKCGATIFFLKTKGGKLMPCDTKRYLFKKGAGKEAFINDFGDMFIGGRGTPDDFDEVGYLTHWGTCPYAKEFRRKDT